MAFCQEVANYYNTLLLYSGCGTEKDLITAKDVYKRLEMRQRLEAKQLKEEYKKLNKSEEA